MLLSVNRLIWLFALLLVAVLAITSVRSLTTDEGDEGYFEEGSMDAFDYDSVDESEIGQSPEKQEYASGPPPQYPTIYGSGQLSNGPPPPPPQYYEQPPVQYVQSPPPVYQPVPVPSYASSTGSYQQEPVYEPLAPQQYTESYAPVYQQQQQPAYQQNYSVPVPVYQQPIYQQQQPAYQQNYSVQAPAPVYQQQQQPIYQQQQNYSVPLPVYQPPVYQAPEYQAPVYQQPQQQQVYQQVSHPPVYQQQQQPNYTKPVVVYQQQQQQQPQYVAQPIKASNYSAPMVSYKPQPIYSPVYLAQKYSMADLAPFTTPFGYRGNHWSLHYYRFNVYRNTCPKQMYTNGPNYKDIEAAFAHAINQVGQMRQGINYMNSNGAPSFAARHQIFSWLSQQNARMDEEGLLVELVSQYLAERLCLTKWDRQRYLPQLTRMISSSQFPASHACSQYHSNPSASSGLQQSKNCYQSKYRSYDGFCNNPYHPYWGKANVCHIRLMSPDYADGISMPRESHNPRYPLPNPRLIAQSVHNDIPLEGPYNLMKMQWGQFINHDISNTALSSYDGLVDCCKQPQTRGCWPMLIPIGDKFYGLINVTCLNFIRSGVCPTCQLGPRQQTNKNTAFLDGSHVYGNNLEQANSLRTFARGQLKTSAGGRSDEMLLPIASAQDQCVGTCYLAGDSRVNQHPALTALHVLLLRNHNRHATALALRHPDWNDEILYQEARRINVAEYQMITFNEYLPIVFGPILSSYFQLTPNRGHGQYTQYNPKTDPTTWNEYTTAACRFGHSQISSVFGLYSHILGYGQVDQKQPTFRLREWFMRPQLLADGMLPQIINGLLARPSYAVDPWITTDVRNHLYQSHREHSGGDLAATNVWRGRDHGLPGYVHYLEYCFNHKVRGWKELQLFIPNYTLNQLRKLYKVVENIDLFTGGLAERHFPGADIGPTFACINGIQYNHLKFGDRFYFEHANQVGSFNPHQLEEIKRASLARLLCRTASVPQAPQYAFMQPSMYNPLVNCSQVGDIDYNKF